MKNRDGLLDLLLKECIITIDVMACQTAFAQQVAEQGREYVRALRQNQSGLSLEAVGAHRGSRTNCIGCWTRPLGRMSAGGG